MMSKRSNKMTPITDLAVTMIKVRILNRVRLIFIDDYTIDMDTNASTVS